MDQLRALRYFSKVAETGSFTRTAAAFSVPPHPYPGALPTWKKTLVRRCSKEVLET